MNKKEARKKTEDNTRDVAIEIISKLMITSGIFFALLGVLKLFI